MPIAEKCTKTSSPPSRSMKPDRKSTRLNSSHSQISYAVFCLKKKKKNHTEPPHELVNPYSSSYRRLRIPRISIAHTCDCRGIKVCADALPQSAQDAVLLTCLR